MKITGQTFPPFGIDQLDAQNPVNAQNPETSNEVDFEYKISGKQMIVAGVALLALGSLGAFIYYQKQNLIGMQNSFQNFIDVNLAKNINSDAMSSTTMPKNGICSNSSTSFNKPIVDGNSTVLYRAAAEIYNEATSNGTDLWNRFNYAANKIYSKDNSVTTIFTICRENSMSAHLPNFSSFIPDFKNILSAPWRT